MPTVLLAVADSAALTASDTAWTTALSAASWTLKGGAPKSDEACTAADLTGCDAVVIAGGTSSGTFQTGFVDAVRDFAGVAVISNTAATLINGWGIATGALASYRASTSSISGATVIDNPFRGTTPVGAMTVFNPASAGEGLREAYLNIAPGGGVGLLLKAVGEYFVFVYPQGAALANGNTAPGARIFATAQSPAFANSTADYKGLITNAMAAAGTASVAVPVVALPDRLVKASGSVELEGTATVPGDVITGVTFTTTDPRGAAAFSGYTFTSPKFKVTFAPQSGSGAVSVTARATAGGGGVATDVADIRIDPAGTQLSTPTAGAIGTGVTDEAGNAITGTAAAAKVADNSPGTFIRATETGNVAGFLMSDLLTVGAGAGFAQLLMSVDATTASAAVSVTIVNAPGATADQVRTGTGTPVITISATLASVAWTDVLRDLAAGDFATFNLTDLGVRVALTALTAA